MKDSVCGLCDHCQLSSPDFQAAAAKIKTCLDQMPPFWQQQCLFAPKIRKSVHENEEVYR